MVELISLYEEQDYQLILRIGKELRLNCFQLKRVTNSVSKLAMEPNKETGNLTSKNRKLLSANEIAILLKRKNPTISNDFLAR